MQSTTFYRFKELLAEQVWQCLHVDRGIDGSQYITTSAVAISLFVNMNSQQMLVTIETAQMCIIKYEGMNVSWLRETLTAGFNSINLTHGSKKYRPVPMFPETGGTSCRSMLMFQVNLSLV